MAKVSPIANAKAEAHNEVTAFKFEYSAILKSAAQGLRPANTGLASLICLPHIPETSRAPLDHLLRNIRDELQFQFLPRMGIGFELQASLRNIRRSTRVEDWVEFRQRTLLARSADLPTLKAIWERLERAVAAFEAELILLQQDGDAADPDGSHDGDLQHVRAELRSLLDQRRSAVSEVGSSLRDLVKRCADSQVRWNKGRPRERGREDNFVWLRDQCDIALNRFFSLLLEADFPLATVALDRLAVDDDSDQVLTQYLLEAARKVKSSNEVVLEAFSTLRDELRLAVERLETFERS